MYDHFAAAFARTRKWSWPDIDEVLTILNTNSIYTLGKVLDVGCGSGRLAEILKNYDYYHGFDSSKALLQIARNNFPEWKFSLGDMRQLSTLLTTSFDTIFFVASFHHILEEEDQVWVLEQARKLLAPHGRIILLNWNLRSEKNVKKYQDNEISPSVMDIPFSGHSRLYYSFTLEELESIYTKSGLKVSNHKISNTTDNFLSILYR